jgi:YidC/Oxa1 family membrane protein insertase
MGTIPCLNAHLKIGITMLDQRNLIVAIVFSVGILVLWQFFFLPDPVPQDPAVQSEQTADGSQSGVPVPGAPTTNLTGAPATPVVRERSAVLTDVPRISIDTPAVFGSLSLLGGRIDDITLKRYREDIDPDSPPVMFLSPEETTNPYFAKFGWTSADELALPDDDTVWQSSDTTMSAGRPVTLTWDNGAGLRFFRTISIDANYMFTVSDRVENYGESSVTLRPFGAIVRKGEPETVNFFILHEGALGVFDEVLDQQDYDDLVDADNGRIAMTPETAGGWIGITDKYWLTALVPDQQTKASFSYNHWQDSNRDNFQVDFHYIDSLTIPAGDSGTISNRVFTGAKVVRLLDGYKNNLGVPGFDRAVDFGLLFFLTKPMFILLRFLSETIGNFGIAILLVTVIVKVIFFPLANRSYRAMSKMKKLGPEMAKIRERFKDDRQRQQQEMMALYKKEGANPVSGCLPIFVQIPVFFALYKVLFVTIEMRHTPFFGWIQDLSAPDPLNLFTGFGLIPISLPEFIPVIGIWPILMGLSMWLQQRLNPQPMDKMQQRIFMLLPIVFTFILAPFPAGLVIYWTWNNILSIAQQWVIMRQAGIKNPAAVE